MIWTHTIDPVAFGLPFGLAVRWYGLVYALGAAMAMAVVPRLWAQAHGALSDQKISKKWLEDVVFASFVAGVLGGRFFEFVFYYPAVFIHNPVEILKIWKGGMSIHGGILGALGALWYFARQKQISLLRLADLVALPLTFVLIFGRLANFANSELVGIPTNSSWGVVFPLIDEIPRHPSQLYHAGKNLLVFLVLLWGFNRGWVNTSGKITGAFLFLYGGIRAALHHWREPTAMIGNVSVGQGLSAGMLVVGVYFLFFKGKQKQSKQQKRCH